MVPRITASADAMTAINDFEDALGGFADIAHALPREADMTDAWRVHSDTADRSDRGAGRRVRATRSLARQTC